MKVHELIGRLRGFDPEAEVRLQLGSRDFAPSAWVGIMDTAGLFDEEKNPQLVIAAWEPEERLKPGSDPAAKNEYAQWHLDRHGTVNKDVDLEAGE